MRRLLRYLGWTTLVIVGLLVLSAGGLLIAANSSAGRAWIEASLPRWTGDSVRIEGLSGRFPNALRLSRLELRDKEGPWLTGQDLALDWSPLTMLTGKIVIEELSAANLDIARAPHSDDQDDSPTGLSLPMAAGVSQLRVARLHLAEALTGHDTTLSLAGGLDLARFSRRGEINLRAQGLDSPERLTLEGGFDSRGINAHVVLEEPEGGPIAGMLGLPGLAPMSLTADLKGPRRAEQLQMALSAGLLKASAQGAIDLAEQRMQLSVTGASPAMTAAPGMAWQQAQLSLDLRGEIKRPRASGRFELKGLSAGAVSLDSLTVELAGQGGDLDLEADLTGLAVPQLPEALLKVAPIRLTGHARLDDPHLPVEFTLAHPLFTAEGRADLGEAPRGTMTIGLPQVAPFASLAGQDLKGRALALLDFTGNGERTDARLELALTTDDAKGGVAGLLAGDTRVSLAGYQSGKTLMIEKAELHGKSLAAQISGSDKGGDLDLALELSLDALQAADPDLKGRLAAKGRIAGTEKAPTFKIDAEGELSLAAMAKDVVKISLAAQGTPATPTAHLKAHGMLGGAPLDLDADIEQRADSRTALSIPRARWRSAEMHGQVQAGGDWRTAEGSIRLQIARLEDLKDLLGQDISGRLEGSLALAGREGRTEARLALTAGDLALAGVGASRAMLEGTVADPFGKPRVDLALNATGVTSGALNGGLNLTAAGPLDGLGLSLTGNFTQGQTPASLKAEGRLDLAQSRLDIATFQAGYCGQMVQMQAPSRLYFGKETRIEALRLGLGQASLDIAGQVAPALDLSVRLAGLAPDSLGGCLATPLSNGLLAIDAHLGGSTERPEGTVHLSGHHLRVQGAPAGTVAAAELSADGRLDGDSMHIEANLKAGNGADLSLSGSIPLDRTGNLALSVKGSANLAMFDPVLMADDQSLKGRLQLDAEANGSLARPCLTGSAILSDGSFQDFSRGIAFADAKARIEATCGAVKIAAFSAKAGPGTIEAAGSVDLEGDGLPVDLTITARNARPLSSDLLTANLDADLSARGPAAGILKLAGTIHVRHADINIPDSFGSKVAVLAVQKRGEIAPSAPPQAAAGLALDIVLDAPEQVFVRGHGIDAEMSGRVTIQGSDSAPDIGGGFDLRHGTFSLASKTLTFTRGRVGFDGQGVTRKIDPTLNFAAESEANNVTATLLITGYADAPKIELTSTPAQPQDEILAQLLFGQSVKQLTPLQIAQIAQAVATLTNVGGGLDPLGAVRKGLGLDRLSAGSSGTTSGASVQAGKYVANGVYVGAQQGISGGTRAQVQIDLTERLKLETNIATGGSGTSTQATPDNDPGSTVGLTYRLEY